MGERQRRRGERRASSSVAQLLSQADAAMYQAKGRARGSVCHYDPRTRPDLEKRAEGSRLLRLALEAHQLMAHYQPIVDLHSGTLVGAEALARWEDPLQGPGAGQGLRPPGRRAGPRRRDRRCRAQRRRPGR